MKRTINSLVLVTGVLVSSVVFAKPVCPSQKFSVFLKRFAGDEVIQKTFTANPLTYVYLDDSGAEIKAKTIRVNPAEQSKPYFLSRYEQNEWTSKPQIKKKGKYTYIVTIEVDNARPQYDFVRKSGCWYLKRYTNLGL